MEFAKIRLIRCPHLTPYLAPTSPPADRPYGASQAQAAAKAERTALGGKARELRETRRRVQEIESRRCVSYLGPI